MREILLLLYIYIYEFSFFFLLKMQCNKKYMTFFYKNYK